LIFYEAIEGELKIRKSSVRGHLGYSKLCTSKRRCAKGSYSTWIKVRMQHRNQGCQMVYFQTKNQTWVFLEGLGM
jgi:hypothetical protein